MFADITKTELENLFLYTLCLILFIKIKAWRFCMIVAFVYF